MAWDGCQRSGHGLRKCWRGSGTGVAFTRDPGTGARGVYGDYLPDAQGEDVVAGIETRCRCQPSASWIRLRTSNCSTS